MKVSIGMPVYNGAKDIRRAIDSLLNQSYSEFELIISDNCSVDGTAEIVREYAKRDDRIKVFNQEENLGAKGNFQFVYEKAKGDYFFWAPHDDFWKVDFIHGAVKALESNPDASSAFGTVNYLDKQGKVFLRTLPPHKLNFQSLLPRLIRYYTKPVTDNLVYSVFKRSILKKFHWKNMINLEKAIILEIVLAGPVVDSLEMEYDNYYSFKTREEIATAFGMKNISWYKEIYLSNQILLKTLRSRLDLSVFLFVLPLFLWHTRWPLYWYRSRA